MRKDLIRIKAIGLALAVCLALVSLPVFRAAATETSAEQQPVWSYNAGNIITSVAISSDGRYVIAGGYDFKVHLFSRASGTPLWSYTVDGYVWSVDISSDGDYMVAGINEGIYLFSRAAGAPIWSYFGLPVSDRLDSVAISSDGNYVVFVSSGGKVCLFSRHDNIPIWTRQTGAGSSVSISSDGSYLAVGSDKLYLFSRTSSEPLWTYETGRVYSVAISSDGNYMAAGTADGKVYLFSRSDNNPIWSYQTSDTVSIASIASVAISSNGSYVAASSWHYDPGRVAGRLGKLYFFSRTSSEPLWSYVLGRGGGPVAISFDGSYIAAGGGADPYGGEERVWLFFRTSSTPVWSYRVGGAESSVRSVAISWDGSYIAAGEKHYNFLISYKVHLFEGPRAAPASAQIQVREWTENDVEWAKKMAGERIKKYERVRKEIWDWNHATDYTPMSFEDYLAGIASLYFGDWQEAVAEEVASEVAGRVVEKLGGPLGSIGFMTLGAFIQEAQLALSLGEELAKASEMYLNACLVKGSIIGMWTDDLNDILEVYDQYEEDYKGDYDSGYLPDIIDLIELERDNYLEGKFDGTMEENLADLQALRGHLNVEREKVEQILKHYYIRDEENNGSPGHDGLPDHLCESTALEVAVGYEDAERIYLSLRTLFTTLLHVATADMAYLDSLIEEIDSIGLVKDTVELVSPDGLAKIQIPENTKASTAEGMPLTGVSIQTFAEPPPPPPGQQIVGLPYDFGPKGATFDPPVTITFQYDQTLIPSGVSEADLVLAFYDNSTGQWIQLSNIVVDQEANTISGEVSHFTLFAVLTPPETQEGYPAEEPPLAPETPQYGWIGAAVLIAVAAIGAAMAIKRRKAHV